MFPWIPAIPLLVGSKSSLSFCAWENCRSDPRSENEKRKKTWLNNHPPKTATSWHHDGIPRSQDLSSRKADLVFDVSWKDWKGWFWGWHLDGTSGDFPKSTRTNRPERKKSSPKPKQGKVEWRKRSTFVLSLPTKWAWSVIEIIKRCATQQQRCNCKQISWSVFKTLGPFHFIDWFTRGPIQVHSTVMAMQRGSTTLQETLNHPKPTRILVTSIAPRAVHVLLNPGYGRKKFRRPRNSV